MISYGLTALLLHLTGVWLYLLVRKGLSPAMRRLSLHLVLAASLLIPLVLPNHVPQAMPMGSTFFQRIPDHQMTAFCRCESPQLGHRVLFRTYALGTWLVGAKPIWLLTSLLMAAYWSIRLIKDSFIMHRIIRGGKKELLKQGMWRLLPSHPYPTSAFWWGKNYLILGKEYEALPKAEQKAVLAHEFSHIRQQNTLEQLLLRLLTICWCWNPVLYWLKKELSWLAECQADDQAAQILGRKAYGQLLLRLQEQKQAIPYWGNALAGSQLYRRIHRLMTQENPCRGSVPLLRMSAIVLVQILLMSPTNFLVSQTMKGWDLYQQASELPDPGLEVLYCTDCETVCVP
ncbi:MAG: M48 family metalloprotease [Bacteroidia bacterium]|nr:M48 family metalloprotease [Bacteroidia bacterium]